MNAIVKHDALRQGAELEITPRSGLLDIARHLPEMRDLAMIFLKAQIVNKQLDTAEKILAVMFKAHELGISQTYALEKMSVINGHINMESELMLALVYKSNSCAAVDIKEGKDVCSVTMQRITPKIKHTTTFSMTDARTAGLTNKENWQKYPKTMCRWRAISECAKVVFPDVLGGIVNDMPLTVRVPQSQAIQEPESPENDAETPQIQDAPVNQPNTETEQIPAEVRRPLTPSELKRRITAYAARVPEKGNLSQLREHVRRSLEWMTDNAGDVGTLLRYFFGKSAVNDLSTGECKSIIRWINLTENGDTLQCEPHSVTEFHAVMRERGIPRSAEQKIFDDTESNNTAIYDAITD